MAVSPEGTIPYDNLWPALIEWPPGMHPAPRLVASGLRLRRFTLCHPQGEALRAALYAHIDDDRLAIETGDIAMQAEFEGPECTCTLS